MIDTDKYENMRQLFLDFIADPMCEEDETAWKSCLNTYDELLAEVKRLRSVAYTKEAIVTIDDWDKSGPCVTVYLEGCEYVGTLSLYKDENGKVIE
tara:strand:- start:372 stop:659 length:288 start_codon:yes stop_codon:yes gene_type:complete